MPILKKPAGESKRRWCNMSWGTLGPVTCHGCGTEHPERTMSDPAGSYLMNRVLGVDVVDECCGRMIDVLYDECGEDFAIAFVKEFALNPTDNRFSVFRIALRYALVDAQKRAQEVRAEVDGAAALLESLE